MSCADVVASVAMLLGAGQFGVAVVVRPRTTGAPRLKTSRRVTVHSQRTS